MMTEDDHEIRIDRESRGLWAEITPAQPPGPEEDPGIPVWVCGGSPHYHRRRCHWLRAEPMLVRISQAADAGFRPCPTCKP